MKQTILGCLGVAVVTLALQFTPAEVQAGLFSNCDPCEPVACNPCEAACDPCGAVCGTKAGKFFLTGHMEAGFWANAHGQTSAYTGTYPFGGTRGADAISGNTGLLQNTRLTGGQINQVYISTGKAVDGRRGLDIGGTVDFTWGSDAYLAQANGLEVNAKNPSGWGSGDYYAAFAQAYAEIEYYKWNVKAGKFYAPFGSDSYKSTENFFYTWSPTMLIVPTTAGGVVATYAVNDKLSVLGGWVNGVDSFGETSKDNAFIGGLFWTPGKRLTLSYTFGIGENTLVATEYFVQSLTATTQLTKRLKYVFDWSLYNETENAAGTKTHAPGVWGLNNELIFQANKKWAFGTRFGVFHGSVDDIATDFEWYNVSLGANWTPNKWLVVKPELRYDWFEKGTTAFGGDVSKREQFSGGMSAVVKF